jgi:hypothetical protein
MRCLYLKAIASQNTGGYNEVDIFINSAYHKIISRRELLLAEKAGKLIQQNAWQG